MALHRRIETILLNYGVASEDLSNLVADIMKEVEKPNTLDTYIITGDSNYGLTVQIVNAENPEQAFDIAKGAGTWGTLDSTRKLDLSRAGLLENL